jgi:hypothetical protein
MRRTRRGSISPRAFWAAIILAALFTAYALITY